MRVLVIPDKFKGTLTTKAAALAISRGWLAARPADSVLMVPMSDGGDGFGDVISSLVGAQSRLAKTVDAAHRPCTAHWWWEPESKTAIVESAAVIGLAMLPPAQFHPFALDTYGLAAVFRSAVKKGARRCLIGVGGSATNDGGFGLARALGWHFLDSAGKELCRWGELPRATALIPPKRLLEFPEMTGAVDVQNALLGPRGATRTYGPQKGLASADFRQAERCLTRLADLVEAHRGRSLRKIPGAGAAGGLGFGLLAFTGATLEPGFDLFASRAQLQKRLRWADLVITGEGSLDSSSLMGKGAGRIAMLCQELNKPCIGLAGRIDPTMRRQKVFLATRSLLELTTVAEATTKPQPWLEQLAKQLGAGWEPREPARRAQVRPT